MKALCYHSGSHCSILLLLFIEYSITSHSCGYGNLRGFGTLPKTLEIGYLQYLQVYQYLYKYKNTIPIKIFHI